MNQAHYQNIASAKYQPSISVLTIVRVPIKVRMCMNRLHANLLSPVITILRLSHGQILLKSTINNAIGCSFKVRNVRIKYLFTNFTYWAAFIFRRLGLSHIYMNNNLLKIRLLHGTYGSTMKYDLCLCLQTSNYKIWLILCVCDFKSLKKNLYLFHNTSSISFRSTRCMKSAKQFHACQQNLN